MECWHLTFAAAGRERLFPDAEATTCAVRALARVAGPRLLLYCVVDDHVHTVVQASRTRAGRIASALSQALAAGLGRRLSPTRIRPVEGRRHLYELVPYVLRQTVRHGLPNHPAAWSGSYFWDLVGARRTPGFDPRGLVVALPRLQEEQLWKAVELSPRTITPLAARDLRVLGPRYLMDAAAAALCTNGRGRSRDSVEARTIAVRMARDSGVAVGDISEELALPRRTTLWLLRRRVAPGRHELVARQVALRRALIHAAPPTPTASELRSLRRSRVLAD